MTRLQLRDLRFKGEITVFASLVFLLMLSLITALLSSATLQMRKSSMRAGMIMALENIFAEYDQEMLNQYDIFARSECDEKTILNRLPYYGIRNGEHDLDKSMLLTDENGLPFYQAAIRYMKDWLGIEGSMGAGNDSFEVDTSIKSLESQTENAMSNLLSQDENTLLEDGNPLGNIQNLKNTSLISILITNEEEISDLKIDTSELPSHRTLKTGVGTFENLEGEGGMTEKWLFTEYLLDHFGYATKEKSENSLAYELEYVLGGKGEDKANLEGVLQKILWIRMGINYAYLLTDEVKKAEAGAMAAGLCVLMTVPGITEVVKQALLLAWAYGESIVDLKVLLKKEKVPLVKSSENWQLQLSNLAKLGTSEEVTGEKKSSKGLDYADYLKGLIALEDRETLCMRSLDLIEKNLSVKVDQCMTRVRLETTYYGTFQTEFGYQ